MPEELINKIASLGYIVRQTGYRDEEQLNKNEYNYRYWVIPEENYKLSHTPFFNTESDFIHFTSIEALFGILNPGYLRLYNLLNMDDKFELDYARNKLSFATAPAIEKAKEEIYCFSMCSAPAILNETPKKKKHLLWKLHGKDGYGTVIRLNIINDPAKWYNFYLTKCFYNLDNFNAIKELHEQTKKEILDPLMACFVKLPIYEFENEIRIIFNKRRAGSITDTDDQLVYPKIFSDKLHKADNISYFQLPIYNFNKNNSKAYPVPPNGMGLAYEIPKVAISEIILGYRYNEKECKHLSDRVAKFDPSITVRISELKEYY